jgi:hypothetical protein
MGPKSFGVASAGHGLAAKLVAMVTFILLLLMESFLGTKSRDQGLRVC